jgi:hypothetical protein
MVVVGEVDVFHSTIGVVLPVSTVIIVAAHQLWYARHRDEIEHGPVHNAIRERRGF